MNGNTQGHEDLLRTLNSSIEMELAEYRGALATIESALGQLRRKEPILGPAFTLLRNMTGRPHTSEGEFAELRFRARSFFRAWEESDARRELSQRSQRRRALSKKPTLDLASVSPNQTNDDSELQADLPDEGRLRQIHEVLAEFRRPMKSEEIAEDLQEKGLLDGVENPAQAVAASLSRGTRDGYFVRVDRGLYALPSSNTPEGLSHLIRTDLGVVRRDRNPRGRDVAQGDSPIQGEKRPTRNVSADRREVGPNERELEDR